MCIKYLFEALFLNSLQPALFSLIRISLPVSCQEFSSLSRSSTHNQKHFQWSLVEWFQSLSWEEEQDCRKVTEVKKSIWRCFLVCPFYVKHHINGDCTSLLHSGGTKSDEARDGVLLSLTQHLQTASKHLIWRVTKDGHKHTFYVSSEVVFFSLSNNCANTWCKSYKPDFFCW